MHEPEAVAITLDITDALSLLAIPHCIVGSFATSLYGFARECQDIDLVADITKQHVSQLVASLQAKFYIAEDAVYEAVEKRSFFYVMHWDTSFKVDIFIAKNNTWGNSELARRRLVTILPEESRAAYVASPEDMLLERFLRYETGGGVSDQYWQDVLGIVTLQAPRLDFSYVTATAQSLGILSSWQRVWRIMDQHSYQAAMQA
jgi:hypothetical protein